MITYMTVSLPMLNVLWGVKVSSLDFEFTGVETELMSRRGDTGTEEKPGASETRNHSHRSID